MTSNRQPRRGVASIQDVLATYLRSAGISRRRGPAERVFAAWEACIGRALARRAKPVRFRGGELVVEVDSSALMHELVAFTGEEHRRRMNSELGKELVHKLVFKQRG